MERMNIPDQQDISSKPTASTTTLEIRVDHIEKMNIIDGTDIMERMNIPDPQDISSNSSASTTTLETRVNPVERITVTVEQTTETERCSSASTRLVLQPLISQMLLWVEILEIQSTMPVMMNLKKS